MKCGNLFTINTAKLQLKGQIAEVVQMQKRLLCIYLLGNGNMYLSEIRDGIPRTTGGCHSMQGSHIDGANPDGETKCAAIAAN